jgi:hypothetical protein
VNASQLFCARAAGSRVVAPGAVHKLKRSRPQYVTESNTQVVARQIRWYQLTSSIPPFYVEPKTYVMPVPGGLLFMVAVAASPMVFVPNADLDSLMEVCE